MVTNTGITVYNKVNDPITRTEKLSRAYIPDCLYIESHGANIITSGLESADSAKIYIPMSSLMNADKDGVDPKHFTDHATQFSIMPNAVVVKGNISELTPTVKYLESTYDHVHIVTTVDIHDYGSGGLHHMEVGCK